ncbi:MAG: DNA-binding domain-containing protein, partial [Silvibacterium sp.]
MSELLELQRRMAAAILHPLTRSETMPRRRRDGVSNEREANALIAPNDRLNSFERLEIYNRQYWFRLYSSFEEDFPGLKAIIGTAKFETLMRDYLTECPSESFTLRNLGSRLENWLTGHQEYIEPRRQLAMDMVRLEWAHIEAFDSAKEELLDADDLAAIDDDSRLRLQPHLRVLELHYPVDDLLIELRNESGSSDASSNNASASRKTKHVRRVAML